MGDDELLTLIERIEDAAERITTQHADGYDSPIGKLLHQLWAVRDHLPDDSPAILGIVAAMVREVWKCPAIHLAAVDESIPLAWEFEHGGLADPLSETFGVTNRRWESEMMAWTVALEARLIPCEEHQRRAREAIEADKARREEEAQRRRAWLESLPPTEREAEEQRGKDNAQAIVGAVMVSLHAAMVAAQMGAAAARKPGECVIGGNERPIKASGLLSRFGLVVDGVPVVVRDEGSE